MFKKTAATAVAITFALSLPADALGLGGGLGGRGKGGKSTSSSSSKSGSSSKSSSSKRKGGISAGASVGRGGVSVGARAGGIGAGASIGRSGASASTSVGSAASAGASVSRSGVSANASVGSAASIGASVSGSGVSTSTSVGGLSVGTSVGSTGVSATIGGVSTPSVSTGQQQQQALSIPASTAALLLLPLPSALQPGAKNRSCIQDGGCRAAPAQLQEGRASAGAPVQTGSSDMKSSDKLAQNPGTPDSIVTACQLAAARAAQAYGAVSVEAASGGEFAANSKGGGIAPVNLRVTYPGSTGSRQARVSCAINSDGVVTGLHV